MAKGRFYGNPTIQNSSPDSNTSPNTSKKLNPIELYQKVVDTKRKQTPMDMWSKAAVATTFENTGVGDSVYDEGVNWNTDIDTDDIEGSLNEYRAEQQSGITQLGFGLVRAGTKAAVEIAKLPGVIGGLAALPFAEEGEGYDTVFNNSWIKGLDKVNEEINTELLPVYAKKAVTEGNLWDNITSTSFWATDGADGLGFMIGMMAPGAIINKLGMGAKLLSSGRKAAQWAGMAEKTETAVTALKSLGLTSKAIDIGAGAVVNTITEAGAEAKGVGDDLDQKKPQYVEQNLPKILKQLNKNNIPELIQGPMYMVNNPDGTQSMQSSGLIPNPEFEAIKSQAMQQVEAGFKEQRALAMRDTFKSNLAILIIPNLLMSKALFGKKTDKLVSNIGKTTMQKVGTRSGNIVKRYGKATASEGFLEEGSQTATETMFVDKAMSNQLDRGDNGFITGGLSDFNIEEATEAYGDMVSSTEGQKAIFLGAAIGAPMMSYQGRKEDVWRQKRSNEILTNIDNSINSFNTIFNNDIYRTDPNDPTKFIYKKDIDSNDTNEREIDKSKALEVAKSLNYNERESKRLDWAIKNGRTDIVEELRERAIFDLIQPSIHYGESGLEALKEKLENSSQFQEVISRDLDPKNKNNSKDFTKKALEVAEHLQKQNEKFIDFAGDVIDLKDDKGRDTKDVKEAFINHLNTQYLQVKYKQYSSEIKLKEAEAKRDAILDELNIPQSALEGNLRQINEASGTNKILSDVLEEIGKTKESIEKNKKDINELWSGKDLVNKSFAKYLDKVDADSKSQSDEKIAKADELIQKIKKSKNKKELDDSLEISNKEMNKAVQEKTIDEVNESIEEDSSIDNLRLNLGKINELGLSSKKINKIINKIEGLLNSKLQELDDFKEFLNEAMTLHNIKSEDILSKILDTEERISKLISDRELLKKSLASQDKSPRGRNAKLLKELIKETKDELERVEKEIESLKKERDNLTRDLEIADKEIEYILTRYNQVEKEQFSSIKDIIDYLENNKKYFTSEHRHGLEKLLINQFVTGKEVDALDATITSLENYVEVLNQTIRNLLDSEENHSEDLYYLQEQLNDSKENLVDYKKELKELTDKLNRLNDSIESKEGINALNKEIEFWEEFQEFKKNNSNELLNNPIINEIIKEKEIELTKKEAKKKAKEEKRQRELEEAAIIDGVEDESIIEPEIIIDENGEFISESIPEETDLDESINEDEPTSTELEKQGDSIKTGVKLVSTKRGTESAIFPNLQQFVDYEKETRDKSNDEFIFEVGESQFMSKEVSEIFNKILNNKTISEKEIFILEDSFPIKIVVNYTTKDEQGDVVNRTAYTYIETKTKAISNNEISLAIYNEQNKPLREKIIKHLITNKTLNGIKTNLHSQFAGVLKTDSLNEDGTVKKNDIFQLSVFNGMTDEQKVDYFQRNTAYVNFSGELVSTLGNKKRIKMMSPNNRGKVFLKIPRIDGSSFWLKLNINMISEEKSEAAYEMVKALSVISESLDSPVMSSMSIEQFFNALEESGQEILSNRLQTVLEEEIELINSFDKGKIGNRSLHRFLDLIVYHKSKNQKTSFNLKRDGSLELGSLAVELMDGSGFENRLSIGKDELQSDQAKEIIMKYLQAKRYNVLITKDAPNLFVFNNKEYVKYLLGLNSGNSMLSTNTVVNEPAFQGFSNIYINQDATFPSKKTPKSKSSDPVSDKAWNLFVDKNEVIDEHLQKIAYKIKDNKPLSQREVAIHSANTSKIEDLLKLISQEVIKKNNKEVISDITYKAFKDRGHVSEKILNEIASKLYNSEPLSDRENEFYNANKKYVNEEIIILGKAPVDIIFDESGGVSDTKRKFANRSISKSDVDSIVKTYNSTDEDGKINILFELSKKVDENINMDEIDKKGIDFVFKELIKIAKAKKLSIEDIDEICSI